MSTFSCRGGTEITEITNSSLQIKKGEKQSQSSVQKYKESSYFLSWKYLSLTI